MPYRSQAAQAAQKTDGGGIAADGATVRAGDADADHIGGAFGAGERVGLGVAVRIDGAQIGQGRLAAGGGGVQQVVQLDQLLENHGKPFLL